MSETIASAAQRIDALEAAVKTIAELHQPRGEYLRYCQVCTYDGGAWPCNTYRALGAVL